MWATVIPEPFSWNALIPPPAAATMYIGLVPVNNSVLGLPLLAVSVASPEVGLKASEPIVSPDTGSFKTTVTVPLLALM